MKRLLPLLALSLAAAPLAHGQIPGTVRRGLASSLASGLSLRATSRDPLTPEQTLVKPPGDQAAPPTAWNLSPPGVGDYSMGTLFGSLATLIEVDAFSTGNDVIPVNGEGVFTPDPETNGRWMSVYVSVSSGSQGSDGSLVRRRQQLGDPGADVFGHYLEDSELIDPALVDTTLLEQTRQAMGFEAGVDVDALDFGMGVIGHAQTTPPILFFPRETELYFSITRASAADVNSMVGGLAWNGSTPIPADGASVYYTNWNETNQAWSPPVVFRSAQDLGLDPADELDALAVDSNRSTAVFSTEVGDGVVRPQLLVYIPGGSPPWPPLKNASGELVSERLGIVSTGDDTEDIDAVCIFDPENASVPLGSHVGTPVASMVFPGVPGPMGISVTRGDTGPEGQEELLFQATGWGGATPGPGTVIFMVSPDYDPGDTSHG